MMSVLRGDDSRNSVRRESTAALIAFTAIVIFVTASYQGDGTLFDRGGIQSVVSRHLTLIDESKELAPLFPFQTLDYLGFSLAILGLLLAAGGGIGGGGILVPIYILVLDFPVKHAIPLASSTVFGGSIANNLLNARKAHPDHPRRLVIDWDLILQLEPMTIAGALIGAVLNDFLPDIVLVVMMVLLLAVTAQKTLAKANKLYEKESEERALLSVSEGLPLLVKEAAGQDVGTDYSSSDGDGDGSLESGEKPDGVSSATWERKSSWEADSKHQVWADGFKLTALFVVVTALNFLKGGPGEAGGGPMGLSTCGASCFWVTEIGIFVIIGLFFVHVRWNLLNRLQSGGPVLSDIEWNERNTVTYPLMAIVAGLVAGLFGVGGGIIKGPLMLELGVHPAVASATSACMIFFTSATATVSYIIFGLLVPDYAVFCLLLGFLSTLVGQTLMAILMQRYRRNSYIAYSIGGVVGISAVAMSIESIIAILGK